nr:hypothetical protein [Tanacetum cinerariifolium]
VLRDGEACKRCTCAKCGSGIGKGLCYICGHNQNSLNDSPSIFETSSHSPPNINHCCYECGDSLDGIFCKRCTCKSCGQDAHIGYNCPLKVSVISIPEPCNNQTIDELPQALSIFHPTFHSEAESPFTLDPTPTYVDEYLNVFNPPPQPLVDDQLLSDEDVPEKIYSNTLFDEEIIPMEIDQHSFNAESDLIKSTPNHDSSIIISSKIDSLFDEFAGELTLLKSFPPGIDETNCHPEKEIHGTTGTLNIKMLGDVSDQKVPIPGLTITRVLNQEKSPDLLSHLGFKAFQPSAECPMIINGKNT